MKVAEITQWIALLSTGTIDDGLAQFGKKLSELPGRQLVSVQPKDPRFSELALEYDPDDKSRLLFVDAHFAQPEAVNHAQLEKRFGKYVEMHPPVDDFSGLSPGTNFIFAEGKDRFSLSIYFQGKVEESVDATRVSLRRIIPLEMTPRKKPDDEAAAP
jgi:hypothetical protein